MINLLPPQVKEQIEYSKRNATLVDVVWVFAMAAVILALIFGGIFYYLDIRTKQAEVELSQKQAVIDHFKTTVSAIDALNKRLSDIKTIRASQSHFSVVLADLAAVTPKGVTIENLELTGDASKPVTVRGRADSYNSAVAFRDALMLSPRISAADIESVTSTKSGVDFALIVAFKAGEAQ